jgi:hypothetical protein
LYSRTDRRSLAGNFFGVQGLFFFLARWTHPLDGRQLDLAVQFFLALWAHPLDVNTRRLRPNCCLACGARIRHAQHLLRHPVGFLLVLIAGLVDRQLRLNHSCAQQALYRLVAPRLRGRERMRNWSMLSIRHSHLRRAE